MLRAQILGANLRRPIHRALGEKLTSRVLAGPNDTLQHAATVMDPASRSRLVQGEAETHVLQILLGASCSPRPRRGS